MALVARSGGESEQPSICLAVVNSYRMLAASDFIDRRKLTDRAKVPAERVVHRRANIRREPILRG